MNLRELVKLTIENDANLSELMQKHGNLEKLEKMQKEFEGMLAKFQQSTPPPTPKQLEAFKQQNKPLSEIYTRMDSYIRKKRDIDNKEGELRKQIPTIDNVLINDKTINTDILFFQKSYKQILGSPDRVAAAKTWSVMNKTYPEMEQGLMNANTAAFGDAVPYRGECEVNKWLKAHSDLSVRDPVNKKSYEALSVQVEATASLLSNASVSVGKATLPLNSFYGKDISTGGPVLRSPLKIATEEKARDGKVVKAERELTTEEREAALNKVGEMQKKLKDISIALDEISTNPSEFQKLAEQSKDSLAASIKKSITQLVALESELKKGV